mmetsp:Transcript_30127/g.86769  ORF Transcript_30127/g.86769 Transcript_30127/m.86769 type:complete len:256 (+) Transcript_30127:332-1099(+)
MYCKVLGYSFIWTCGAPEPLTTMPCSSKNAAVPMRSFSRALFTVSSTSFCVKAPVLSSSFIAVCHRCPSRISTAELRSPKALSASGRFGALSSWFFSAKTWFTVRLALSSPSLSPTSSNNFKASCAGASASCFLPAPNFAIAMSCKVLACPARSPSSRSSSSAVCKFDAAPAPSPRATCTSASSCKAFASDFLSPALLIIASSSVAARLAANMSPTIMFACTTTSKAPIFVSASLPRRADTRASAAALRASCANT